MFNKNYYCTCGCGGNNCYNRICTTECYRLNHNLASESLIYEQAYRKGRYDERREVLEEKVRCKTPEEQHQMLTRLIEAMKPLEQLKKELV